VRDLITGIGDFFTRPTNHVPMLRNDSPVPFAGSVGGLFGEDGSLPVGERAYEAHGSVGTLFAIVGQIGNAFATAEWHLYKKGPARDKSRRKEIENHPLLKLWNKPNDFYTGRLFRETVQQHLDLVGEGIFVLSTVGKVILEMWPVRPDRMQPVKHPEKYMTGWIYEGPNGEKVPLELNQVIQIRYPNPGDPYRGRGPVQTVLSDMDAARYSAEWNKNFFINGARPGGIITVDYRMTDTEFRAFMNRWREQHRGVANAHRVALLENATWTDTAFSMQDMQFAELRNLPRELIREAFAFPKPMLGTVDDVNRANAEAGKEIMAEGQTIPRLDRWKDILNNFLLPMFPQGDKLEMDYDDPTPVNHEAADRAKVAQSTAVDKLVKAGYDPAGVLEWAGMPEIKWVGLPSPAMAPTPKNENAEPAPEDDLGALVDSYWK
jgi:HK97 family phage portal protein